jgi:hypothetical protein
MCQLCEQAEAFVAFMGLALCAECYLKIQKRVRRPTRAIEEASAPRSNESAWPGPSATYETRRTGS